jgi:hypothetical protein
MSDYNWFSHQAVQVATEGLRDEGKKWHGLSDRMSTVSSNAANQSLQVTAFAVTDALTGAVTALDLKSGYDKMYEWLNSLFNQAVVEFDNMGDALRKNADWYEHADANSAQNFDAIAKS